MTQFQNNSIFWVEVDKIRPNPYQPRREFDEDRLSDLAESIRMYGVLQPLTVTRVEKIKADGGLVVEYELIAGERRHRASKIAGLAQVPVIIRSGPEDAKIKLELAIIENLQREDLNPIDRAKAFEQLANEFKFTHAEIAKKMGKSREYVSNSLRLLQMPEEIQMAIVEGKMSEGHSRPIMMLADRPEEQATLFKEIVIKKMTVREAERIARSIAHDKVRKKETMIKPEIKNLEDRLSQSFGTRVHIEERSVGGKLIIDYFSVDDLQGILDLVNASMLRSPSHTTDMLQKFIDSQKKQSVPPLETEEASPVSSPVFAEQEPQLASLYEKNDAVPPETNFSETSSISSLETSSSLPNTHINETSLYPVPESSLSIPSQNQDPINDPTTTVHPVENSQDSDDDMYSISKFTF